MVRDERQRSKERREARWKQYCQLILGITKSGKDVLKSSQTTNVPFTDTRLLPLLEAINKYGVIKLEHIVDEFCTKNTQRGPFTQLVRKAVVLQYITSEYSKIASEVTDIIIEDVTSKRIYHHIAEHPGEQIKDICEDLALRPDNVFMYIEFLVQNNFVFAEEKKGQITYHSVSKTKELYPKRRSRR